MRSQAAGSHYSSTDELLGAMAERTVIDLRCGVVLPDGIDPVQVAAAMNP
ncbi:hypothetical protein [Streptomyces sp. NPDC056660]